MVGLIKRHNQNQYIYWNCSKAIIKPIYSRIVQAP